MYNYVQLFCLWILDVVTFPEVRLKAIERTNEIKGLMSSVQLHPLISICCLLSQAGSYTPMYNLARGSFLAVVLYLVSCLTSHTFYE